MAGWSGAEDGPPCGPLAVVPAQPLISQRTQRSLPGPAGRISATRPAASTLSIGVGGGGGGGGSLGAAQAGGDPDFASRPWLQALQDVDADDFDENREPFKDNTVRAAIGLQQSGVLDRLLAVVVAVKRCHSGEAFVRLKDPTGAIGGTLTQAALDGEPGIQQGAVLVLRRVAVLRTPPPRSLSHLCITLVSVLQVISPPCAPTDGRRAAAAQQQQQQPRLLPLPAPPPHLVQPAASWQQQPSLAPAGPAIHAPLARQPSAPSSSCAWPSLATAAPPPSSGRGVPQLAGAHTVQHARLPPISNCVWPSIVTVPGGAPPGQPPQQMPPPSAGLPARTAAAPGTQQQQQQQVPANSESVNFSMPSLSPPPPQQQRQAWQDDATSLPAHLQQQQDASSQLSPAAAAAAASRQQVGAPAGWLQGLLAEAEFDPFALGPSQQPSANCRRPVLSERQPTVDNQQQGQLLHGVHASKRHCTDPSARPPPPQYQGQPPGTAAFDGAVFGEVDELDLDE